MKQMTTWLFRHADGSFSQDVWSHRAHDLDALLAAAHRDALLLAGDRNLVALTALEPDHQEPGPVPDDPPATQRKLLAEVGLSALPDPAPAPLTLPVRWHRDPLAMRWYDVTSPFGTGSITALELLRCTRVDEGGPDTADALGECFAHQSSLYAVTPVVLPFVVDLLMSSVPGRSTLAGWLLVVAESAEAVGPESPEEAWKAVRRQIPELLRDNMRASLQAHVRAGHRIQRQWKKLARRLRSDVRIHDLVAPTLEAMERFE